MNHLYYGDNLQVLREHIKDESVDLIYLDPPFNSQATYNVLFKSSKGKDSAAQIEAFEDTWTWGEQAEAAYYDITQGKHKKAEVAQMIIAMRVFLGDNNMMAYLVNMAARLVELHRVLKPTGSLYLHCDPTASHYLKVILDGIFDIRNFRNEITWKRQTAHSDARRKFADVTDIVLFFSKSNSYTFSPIYSDYNSDYIGKFYRFNDNDGRGVYRLDNIASPNPRPNMMYEWMGFPYPEKGWRYQRSTMQTLHNEGRIWYPKSDDGNYDLSRRPQIKRFLREQKGQIVTNIWSDINPLHFAAQERLGYPTQKPLALLERIIFASSNEGDVILDPFCGCGTALHAAQKLNRNWIGIDITHLAISLIERRLRDAFPQIEFEVHGTPKDLEGARDLADRDKYQFQWWALSLVNAMPVGGKKKGADRGIDGVIYATPAERQTVQVIVSVKGGENVTVSMIRDLKGVLEREKAAIGLFITLTEPTTPMRREAHGSGYYECHNKKYPKLQILTIEELLNGKKPDIPSTDPEMWKKPKKEDDLALLNQKGDEESPEMSEKAECTP